MPTRPDLPHWVSGLDERAARAFAQGCIARSVLADTLRPTLPHAPAAPCPYARRATVEAIVAAIDRRSVLEDGTVWHLHGLITILDDEIEEAIVRHTRRAVAGFVAGNPGEWWAGFPCVLHDPKTARRHSQVVYGSHGIWPHAAQVLRRSAGATRRRNQRDRRPSARGGALPGGSAGVAGGRRGVPAPL